MCNIDTQLDPMNNDTVFADALKSAEEAERYARNIYNQDQVLEFKLAHTQASVELWRVRATMLMRRVLKCTEKQPRWMEIYDVFFNTYENIRNDDAVNMLRECMKAACISVWSTHAFENGLLQYMDLLEPRLRQLKSVAGRPHSLYTVYPERVGNAIYDEAMRLWQKLTRKMDKVTCAHFQRSMTKHGILPADPVSIIIDIVQNDA